MSPVNSAAVSASSAETSAPITSLTAYGSGAALEPAALKHVRESTVRLLESAGKHQREGLLVLFLLDLGETEIVRAWEKARDER